MDVEINDFIIDLERAVAGMDDVATRHLQSVLTAGWTSSSEMLGEIGIAIRRVEASVPDMSIEARAAFARAMREVHKVWPQI